LLKDGSAAQNLALDIERTQAEVQRADERLAQLQLRAQVAGTLVMPRQGDLMGAYMRQGVTLGHVLAPEQMRVRAAVPEADAQLVRHRFVGAQVRLADAPEQSWPAQRGADVPAATRTLPSAALADVGGGPYASDPDQKDGTHILEPVFLIDLSLAGHRLERVGGRAWVNFDHGSEPLAQQIYRRATQLFLRHFAPSA
jgi:putative peptide zinc metalloprotease protein